jgi:archaemetzincin
VTWRKQTIRLVRIGDGVPLEVRDRLGMALARTFGFSCQTVGESVDPGTAFDANRNQYHSTALLRQLASFTDNDGARVLGITGVDLYVPVLTFVFGEAELPGHCAIVSCHRLRDEFYGLPSRPDLFEERLVKEALHELGHTFGLRHCASWGCVMASTHSVERLDLKTAEFCPECKRACK